jgi:hypothetical protein
MRLKYFGGVLSAAALIFATGACDTGLTEVNENPNAPEEVPVENVLASGMLDALANESGVGAFGEWTTLYHTELWAQHLAQAQYNDEDKYNPRAGIPTQVWDVGYAGALRDFQYVKLVADEESLPNLWAVAEIMSVYQFLTLTDLFGDVPYSEALALDEDIQNPKYDPQSEIYPDLIARLQAAAGRIDASESEAPFAVGDLIYDGDMQQWYEFANSLQLRIAARMSGSVDMPTSLAGDAATAFAAAWNSDIFDDVTDNADIDWPGEQPVQNPVYEQIVLGARTGDFRVSSSLVDRLTDMDDPRLEIFADPAVSDGEFRGLRNGLTPPDYTFACTGGPGCEDGERSGGAADFSTIGARFMAADAPNVLMSYAEMLFLGAEAAERGWIAGGAARGAELYEAGVRASLEQYGVGDAEATAYLAQAETAYDGLPSIYEQKWIALYLAGSEGFNEFRRTGQPELVPAAGSVLPAGMMPARLPYPTEEALYNPDNFPTVDLEDPLWWASVNR